MNVPQLLQVRISASNTSTEASAVSPQTSLDKQSPAAADFAAGRTNTPSGHPPVVNPQTVNPAGMPVESMEQAGSAPTSARAIESLPTSPPNPAAGSVAAGQAKPLSAAAMLVHLAEKRRRWVTEVNALQLAIGKLDELVMELQGLEER